MVVYVEPRQTNQAVIYIYIYIYICVCVCVCVCVDGWMSLIWMIVSIWLCVNLCISVMFELKKTKHSAFIAFFYLKSWGFCHWLSYIIKTTLMEHSRYGTSLSLYIRCVQKFPAISNNNDNNNSVFYCICFSKMRLLGSFAHTILAQRFLLWHLGIMVLLLQHWLYMEGIYLCWVH